MGVPRPLGRHRGQKRPLLACLVLWATAGLLLAASAHGSPSWGRARTISQQGMATLSAPDVAMLPSGEAVATWGRPTPEGVNFGSLIVAVRPRGGRFAPALRLSPAGRRVSSFDLAGSSAGEAIVVWTDFPGLQERSGQVRVAVRSPGGSFGPGLTLSGPGAGDARLATGPGGTATVVWAENGRIRLSDRPAGGSFGPVRTVSEPGRRAARPAVVIGPSGETIVMWGAENCPNGPGCEAYGDAVASIRPPGGAFRPPQTVSRAGSGLTTTIGSIELVTDGGGEATALWNSFISGGLYSGGTIHAAIRPPGGGFGQVRSLFAGGASGSALLIDGAGRTIALWGEGTETAPGGDYNPRIVGTSRSGGAAFGRVRQVERGGQYPSLATAAGRAIAVWSRGRRLRAAVRRRDGYCAVSISPSSRALGLGSLAGDGAGRALAVWGTRSRVWAADGQPGRRRPNVRRFSVGPRRFSAGRRRTPRVAARRGTAFRFSLSEAARVQITIERRRRDRRVGSLIRGANAGRHTVRFSGRLGRRRLRPGPYRARIRATDCDGRSSSRRRPRAVRFRVVR